MCEVLTDLGEIPASELVDLSIVARVLGFASAASRWTPRSARRGTGC